MDEIGVGIVGCGNISTIYLTNLPHAPGVKVRACADMKPEVAAAQGKKFGVEAMPVDALLARDDIDIVVNLTIPAAHGDGVARGALAPASTSSPRSRWRSTSSSGGRWWRRPKSASLMVGCAPDTFLGAGGRLSAQAHRRRRGRQNPLRHCLPDVARHGALASGPGVLLQEGRGTGARRRRLLHHGARQSARPGRARPFRDAAPASRSASSPPTGPQQGLSHQGRDADDVRWRCSNSRPARS